MLDLENLSVDFRRYQTWFRQRQITRLSHVSLGLGTGEVLAVVGASGAGKSLLAHAILSVLPGNAIVGGDMKIDGKPLDHASQKHLRGRRIALVPQSVSHLDPLARNGHQIAWAAQRAGRKSSEIGGLSATTLGRFNLGASVARSYPHALSGGMARRVMLAIATIGNADLIIADEPTNGLDPVNAGLVLDLLRKLADEGRAVMVITHDLIGTLPFADRVAIMDDGRLIDIEPARRFEGRGDGLVSPYARQLWRALPQNGFGLVRAGENA